MATTAMQEPGGNEESTTSQRPLLLVTTVDIGEGNSDKIEVREGDEPMEVAKAFVTKHKLPQPIIPRLALHLEDNLAKVAAQKHAAQQAKHTTQEGGSNEDAEVFHRLYEQAVALRQKLEDKRDYVKKVELNNIKQNRIEMSWISSEMMRDRSSGPFGNYGQMLYAESLEAMEKKKEKIHRREVEKQEEEVAGVTFHPEISRLAQNLWTPQECASVPAWQRLSKVRMTKAQERLEMLRREKEEAEMKECSFKPQLNSRSEKLMTERSNTLRSLNVSAHQQLYQDAVRRQQKQQDYQHWYPEEVTFHPKLHESAMSREFLRKSLGADAAAILSGKPEERHTALVNRLYASYEKLQNKLQEARNALQSHIDPVTGKRLFHPETGRGPSGARKAGNTPVGEYLYSLKQQQDEKVKAALEEQERKLREQAARAKQSKGSKEMVKVLQQKRFQQIFEFLDQEGLGQLNLVAVMNSMPEWLTDLDDEVRADLEFAAMLLAKRGLKHNDSGKSEGSLIFMPPPPAIDPTSINGGSSGDEVNSISTTPTSHPSLLDFPAFCSLMMEVLNTRRCLRTYLAPSPPRKYVPTETYRPQIDERSKQLAAKVRPKDTPLHDILYQESQVMKQKLEEKKAVVELERTQACTFAPKLVSKQLVEEGRVMKGVRDGTWYKPTEPEIENADNLQALAEMVVCSDPPAETAPTQHSPAADSNATPAAEDSYSGHQEIEQDIWAAAARTATQQEQEQLQELQRQIEREQQQAAEDAAAYEAYKQEYERQEAERIQQQQQGAAYAEQRNVAAEEEEDDFEDSEEQRQYLELEREVQQMLAATTAVTAAAERLQSPSEQQYLSQILGLAQEQVDAMAPAITHLQGLESYQSRYRAEHPAGCSVTPAACRSAEAADSTPASNTELNVPYSVHMETSAAESACVAEAFAAAGMTNDDYKTLGLLRSQYGGEASAVVSREPSKTVVSSKSSSNLDGDQQGISTKQHQHQQQLNAEMQTF